MPPPAKPAPRKAKIARQTRETKIEIALVLDGAGRAKIDTGVAFFDHLLDQIARHGKIDLTLKARGDLAVDAHHTIEDCGIVFGQALARALGDKAGIARFGFAYAPLDESLSRAVVDFSGRGGLFFHARWTRETVGGFDSDLAREFFRALAAAAGATLHLDVLRGVNAHHQIESLFKAFALALAAAAARSGGGVPSTKGVL